MSPLQHVYRYSDHSTLLNTGNDQYLLRLVADLEHRTDTSYFSGKLLNPLVSARCLRTVSDLVGTRFYIPPSMLTRILLEADPVATVTQSHLRFEGFSACCSTYIRHDMASSSFEAEQFRSGTTNVDFGAAMRSALANIRDTTPLSLTVRQDAVELRADSVVIEKRVPLPVRWVKGFAEVQSHLSAMEHKFTLSRIQAQRFLRSLPRGKADHEQWVLPTPQGARLATRPTPDGVMVKGTQRLLLLEKLASLCDKLRVWFNPVQGSSSWILDFGGQHLLMTLNSEPWRGFSGDGSVLSDLATVEAGALAEVKAQLSWQPSLDVADVASATGHTEDAVRKAMGALAAQGLLGFDLDAGSYFHRVLPFDLSSVNKQNPRLKSATELYEKRAVSIMKSGASVLADVVSGGVTHQVTIEATGNTCTCPWYSKHKTSRGACKHILATEMTLDCPV